MFDKQGYIEPVRRKEDESTPQKEPEARPAEKITPSQEGRYLSALEKKGKEKKTSKGKDAVGGKESAEEKEGDLFHLARTSSIKEHKGTDADAGGEQQPSPQMGQGTPQQGQMSEGEEPSKERERISPISGQTSRGTKEILGWGKKGLSTEEQGPMQPRILPAVPEITPKEPAEASSVARTIRPEFIELARQMADSISTLISKAETTITVSLKYPPTFEGASLVVTEHQLATKEFNVTFMNLSPDARRLIEATANQQQIRQALVERGYTLHMITIEAPPSISAPRATSETEFRREQGGDSKKEDRPRK